MTQDEAKRLQACVNEAIDAAQKLPPGQLSDAVNWMDLECSDVEERRSLLAGTTMIAVIIEEASPNATGLQNFVGDWLDSHGFPNIYVCTEW